MIPAIIAGLVVVAVGGTTAYFWKDIFSNDRNKEKWREKVVVLIGSQNSGKTTFANFLRYQDVNKIPFSQTTIKESIGKNGEKLKVDIGNVKIYLKGFDLGGSRENHDVWKDEINKSDIILYFFDISKVFFGDKAYEERIRSDLSAVSEKIRKKGFEGKSIILVGTHSDKVNDQNSDDLYDFLKNSSIGVEMLLKFGGADFCKLKIGSLANNKQARALVEKVLNYLD